MKLHGVISNNNGLGVSMSAMLMEMNMIGVHNENIMGFDKIGYQRKRNVIPSFAEHIGVMAHSVAVDDSVGRLESSEYPLDIALSEKGYFQVQGKDGTKLTRDGRFKLDKDGYLLTQENQNVLSTTGIPIKLPCSTKDIKDIKIDTNGTISLFNREKMDYEPITTLSVVSDSNVAVLNPGVRQGFNEYSNVSIYSEFMRAAPVKRNFEANRRMFVIQSAVLTNMISKLSQG